MSLDARLTALAEQAKGGPSLGRLYKVVDRLIARGDPQDVAFLLREYRDLKWPDGRVWVYKHLLDYLPAVPRPEMAEQLLRHLIEDAPPVAVIRRAADMLVLGQPHGVVERWIEQFVPNPRALPVLGLLAHSFVLVGRPGAGTPWGEPVRRALQRAGDPLGGLPLVLHGWEGHLARRHYSYRVGWDGHESMPMPSVSWSPAGAWPVDQTPALPPFTVIANAEGLTAPFDLWVEESNARLEARTLEFGSPVPTLTPHLLAGLGLESVASPGTLHVQPCTPSEVLAQLFRGGLTGGAYGASALYSAHARLAAWRSLGALAGSPLTGEVEAVAEAARGSQFTLYFDVGGSFFFGLFDFAVACLRPDGRSLVALAVTDTD